MASGLSPTQLEWRPTAYGRGVAEWIEHLVKTGDAALARIHAAMLPAWRDPVHEDRPYRRTLAGHCAIAADRIRGDGHNAVHGGPRRSTRPEVIRAFLAQQDEVLNVIDEARDVDLHCTPSGWVIGGVSGLCVGDTLELLALRQRRGLSCISRVIATSGFPCCPVAPPLEGGGMLKLA